MLSDLFLIVKSELRSLFFYSCSVLDSLRSDSAKEGREAILIDSGALMLPSLFPYNVPIVRQQMHHCTDLKSHP